MHDDAPTPENVPETQFVHCAAPPVENVPAGQLVQLVAPIPEENCVAPPQAISIGLKSAVKRPSMGTGAKLPPGQGIQAFTGAIIVPEMNEPLATG